MYDADYVRNILGEYKMLKKEEKIKEEVNEEVRFMEKCLAVLELYERDLIEKTMIEKMSVRKYSRISGFSRNFITKEQKKIIDSITKFFSLR